MKYTNPLNNYDNDFWIAIDKLITDHRIIIDRPKGSTHPKFKDMVLYTVDYGYLQNTKSMDNGGIDIFVGTKQEKSADCIICTVDLLKGDSEIKILYGCLDEEKESIYKSLNNKPSFKGIMINRYCTK